MNKKECSICHGLIPFIGFSKKNSSKDGLQSYCKRCRSIQYQINKVNELDYSQKYYMENKTKILERQHKYKTKNHRKILTQNNQYRQRNKTKSIAHEYIKRALKNGILIKQPCIFCSNPNSNAHHFDYDKPDKVMWLCDKHHSMIHRKTIKIPEWV